MFRSGCICGTEIKAHQYDGDCRSLGCNPFCLNMTCDGDPDQVWLQEAIVARMKAEIIEEIVHGPARIPATVPDFSSLHDYIDANELGGLCDDDAPSSSYDPSDPPRVALAAITFSDVTNAAQDEVDRWLKDGGLLDALGVVTVFVRLDFLPTDQTGPLNVADVQGSLEVRLEEVYVTPDNIPVTPIVTPIDGPA